MSGPLLRMLAICAALMIAMKAAVLIVHRRSGGATLSPAQLAAFVLGWPGMDPQAFAALFRGPQEGAAAIARAGLARLVVGAALLVIARAALTATGSEVLALAIALPGLSLMLHFGICSLAAGLWRALGADVGPLFRAPLASTSLAEFWGRRWNLAFADMTRALVYRPLAPRIGRPPAVIAGFAFSGLLHELAISAPVGAGYGLPTLYFALHGVLVALELRHRRRRRGGDVASPNPLAARLWTLGWLAGPLLLCFHPPFLRGIVLPLIRP